jgi:hypothetical protein
LIESRLGFELELSRELLVWGGLGLGWNCLDLEYRAGQVVDLGLNSSFNTQGSQCTSYNTAWKP